MTHGRLSHMKQPGSAFSGVGRMDGMSSDRSELQLRSLRTGGWGSACCILLLVCRMEVWTSMNQLWSGGLDRWCMTMKGVLLVLCLGLYCSVSELGVLLAPARASWTFFRWCPRRRDCPSILSQWALNTFVSMQSCCNLKNWL